MSNKIELLVPAGSFANLKAAVSKGADAVYLGMDRFSAREYATNFNGKYLKEAVRICKSNNVKLYLTMNTLVKNDELRDFFNQLSFAYENGIDAVIIQEISFIDIIRRSFPGLKIHISTQAGVMNSEHAHLLAHADRINLARELSQEEIKKIRDNYKKELEIFCHGALCVSLSGACLFSSFLGGRSGNRGRCAQPCRKKYGDSYYLSTKELCLVKRIPDIIGLGTDSMKIEGRMRTPYYVATVTSVYRSALDNFYKGHFEVKEEAWKKLQSAFTREFTEGKFSKEDVFNRKKATGESTISQKEQYEVEVKDIEVKRNKVYVQLPEIIPKKSKTKQLIVRVYNKGDALSAAQNGADILCYDLFSEDFKEVKEAVKCKVFAVTPRIMLDTDVERIKSLVEEKKPDGIFAGNLGILSLNFNLQVYLDYNLNCFNDIDLVYLEKYNATPIISPELSILELTKFKNKNFISLVHGKIRLMTLKHELESEVITDEKGGKFKVNKVYNGSEILNEKELGLLSKSNQLISQGINNLYLDTENNVAEITKIYRSILDGKKIDDSKLKKDYVLGWAFRGVE
jgi:collagenase-like PrtC family protease